MFISIRLAWDINSHYHRSFQLLSGECAKWLGGANNRRFSGIQSGLPYWTEGIQQRQFAAVQTWYAARSDGSWQSWRFPLWFDRRVGGC
jgi:hypothetical protein